MLLEQQAPTGQTSIFKFEIIQKLEGTVVWENNNAGSIGGRINFKVLKGKDDNEQLLLNHRIVSWAGVNFFEK